MRKGRRKASSAATEPQPNNEATYFRLCHFCLHLNESPSDIVRCERCKGFLSAEPMLRYGADGGDEDEEEMSIPPDEEFVAPTDAYARSDRRRRVTGLSVLW